MFRTPLLTLIFFQLLIYEINGQNDYYFKSFQVEQGLSNNGVMSSAQDSSGFLWFGTLDGLNRFDGYSFKVFRSPQEHLPGRIGNNSIEALYADTHNLFVGTQNGLYLYHPESETFSLINDTRNRSVRAISNDGRGNMWLLLNYELFRYNRNDNRLEPWLRDKTIRTLSAPDGNGLWVFSDDGLLYRFDADLSKFRQVVAQKGTFPQDIERIKVMKDGNLLIGTFQNSIYQFNPKTGDLTDILKNKNLPKKFFTRDIVRYSTNEYWIATEQGLIIYNAFDGNVRHLARRDADKYALQDNALNTILRDKEGGMWVGTRFAGVNHCTFPFNSFTRFFPMPGQNSISGTSIHDICADSSGKIWIGTEDAGLNKYDPASNTFTHFLPGKGRHGLSSSNIHGLLSTGNELWVGTFQYGIEVLNTNREKVVRRYNTAKENISHNFVVHLFKSRKNEIYAGTWSGLDRYDASTDRFVPVPGLDVQTQSIIEDGEGKLWICTLKNGVYVYDPQNNTIANFSHSGRNSLPSNMVSGIYQDHNGSMWFATNAGLSKLDPESGVFTNYDKRHGLPDNFLFRIVEDNTGILWISSTNGLFSFDPTTENVQVFKSSNGLLSNQFNWNSALRTVDGRMYFGSVKGMISFLPENFTLNRFTPPVYITGFQIHNKEVEAGTDNSPLSQAITVTKSVTLTHEQSTFSVDFASLSYSSPETNEYAYMLDGLENEWTHLTTNRKAYFTHVKPGTYQFRLRASNSSGVWNPRETSLEIIILPPVWASRWAYFLYTLLAVSGVLIVVRGYHNRTREKNTRKMQLMELEKEKELYHAKMEFFTNIAHEIRTPLTLIKGPLEKLSDKAERLPDLKSSIRIMERNTNRLVDLTNQLLDLRLIESSGFRLQLSTVNVTELLLEIHSNFSPVAEQKKLNYELALSSKDVETLADADALQKIISNLYSNAFKYTAGTVKVRLILDQKAGNFQIEIKNDGYVIPAEMKEKIFEPFVRLEQTKALRGTGIGLALSRSLAELHKGTLKLSDSENSMNVFILTIPLSENMEPHSIIAVNKKSLIN